MTCRLLVDVGNSRIKWALLSPEGLSLFPPFESDPKDLKASLDQAWGALSPPSAVALSNVRGEVVESLILDWVRSTWKIEVFVAKTQDKAGDLLNGYKEPQTLGVDRWLGLLGLSTIASLPAMIVDLGTAITLDLLDHEGQHQGGYIAPGLRAMHEALAGKTHALKAPAVEAPIQGAPAKDTAEGITLGCCLAAAGLIEKVAFQARGKNTLPLTVVLTGGDAESIGSHLSIPYRIDQTLIFKGLERMYWPRAAQERIPS